MTHVQLPNNHKFLIFTISFSFSLFKFFMIFDDSFSRLTTRMIVHDSFLVSCFQLVITGPIAVRKHAAAIFCRKKINTFTSLSYGTAFSFHIFTRRELGISSALMTLLAQLAVNYRQLSQTSLAI